jgi:hypothetical protein
MPRRAAACAVDRVDAGAPLRDHLQRGAKHSSTPGAVAVIAADRAVHLPGIRQQFFFHALVHIWHDQVDAIMRQTPGRKRSSVGIM